MRYGYRGLGADCLTPAKKRDYETACRYSPVNRWYFCAEAQKPICEAPPPPPPPPEAVVAPAPVATGPARAVMTSTTAAMRYTKLPVRPAAPEPISPPVGPPPAPAPGVPTWVWIAGGAAVLGGAALFFSRRKAA